MENVKKDEAVAILKAVIVNKVEFSEPVHHERLNGKLCRHNYEAAVSVKVGNSVNNITLFINRDYVSSTGNYANGTYVESHHTPYAPKIYSNPFAQLIDAGIEVDFSDVFTHYQKLVWEKKNEEQIIKRAANSKRFADSKAIYESEETWFHTFLKNIKNDKNSYLNSTNFELEIPNKRSYCTHHKDFVKIIYKGFIGTITLKDGRFVWTEAYSKEKGDKYNRTVRISGTDSFQGKTVRAKRGGTSLFKFLKAVDAYTGIQESRKNRAKTEKEEREEKRLLLEKESGYDVLLFSDTKYNRDHRGRSSGAYLSYTYKIITKKPKKPKSEYSSHEGYSINIFTYDNETTYSIRGLDKLNKKQFNTILNSLMEGKKSISRSEYNKK